MKNFRSDFFDLFYSFFGIHCICFSMLVWIPLECCLVVNRFCRGEVPPSTYVSVIANDGHILCSPVVNVSFRPEFNWSQTFDVCFTSDLDCIVFSPFFVLGSEKVVELHLIVVKWSTFTESWLTMEDVTECQKILIFAWHTSHFSLCFVWLCLETVKNPQLFLGFRKASEFGSKTLAKMCCWSRQSNWFRLHSIAASHNRANWIWDVKSDDVLGNSIDNGRVCEIFFFLCFFGKHFISKFF